MRSSEGSDPIGLEMPSQGDRSAQGEDLMDIMLGPLEMAIFPL